MARTRSLGRAPLYLVLVTGILWGTVWLNTELRSLRESEVNTALRTYRLEEVSNRNLVILGRVDLMVQRLVDERSPAGQLLLEARLETMLGDTAQNGPGAPSSLAMPLINAVRALLGKPALQTRGPDPLLTDLEEAYVHERLRRFREAERMYRTLLERGVPQEWESAVLFHLAFCVLMQGRLAEADGWLDILSRDHPGSEEAAVAPKMREVVRRFESLRRGPVRGNALERARLHARRLEFAQAQREARTVLDQPVSLREKAAAIRVLAEIAEQEGDFETAEQAYENIVLSDPDGPAGLEARRRLAFVLRFLRRDSARALEHEAELVRRGDGAFVSSLVSLDRSAPSPAQARATPSVRRWILVDSEPGPSRVLHRGETVGWTPALLDPTRFELPLVLEWRGQGAQIDPPFTEARYLIRWRVEEGRAAIPRLRGEPEPAVAATATFPPPPEEPEAPVVPSVSAPVAWSSVESLQRYHAAGWWIRDGWIRERDRLWPSLGPEDRARLEEWRRLRETEEAEVRERLRGMQDDLGSLAEHPDRLWWGASSLAAGAVLLGVMGWSVTTGNALYERYRTTEDESIVELRLPLTLLSVLAWTSGVLGGLGLGGGGWLLWEDGVHTARRQELQRGIERWKAELARREPPRDPFPE